MLFTKLRKVLAIIDSLIHALISPLVWGFQFYTTFNLLILYLRLCSYFCFQFFSLCHWDCIISVELFFKCIYSSFSHLNSVNLAYRVHFYCRYCVFQWNIQFFNFLWFLLFHENFYLFIYCKEFTCASWRMIKIANSKSFQYLSHRVWIYQLDFPGSL